MKSRDRRRGWLNHRGHAEPVSRGPPDRLPDQGTCPEQLARWGVYTTPQTTLNCSSCSAAFYDLNSEHISGTGRAGRVGWNQEPRPLLRFWRTQSHPRAAASHGDLPGGVLQDVSAIEREDAGPGLQPALGAREQGLPAGEQHLVLQGEAQGAYSVWARPARGTGGQAASADPTPFRGWAGPQDTLPWPGASPCLWSWCWCSGASGKHTIRSWEGATE